jgi:hypothetical protein
MQERLLLPLILTAAATTGALALRTPPGQLSPDQAVVDPVLGFDAHHQLIFSAVLEGLYADGVSTQVAERLLATDGKTTLFIPGCQICMPARQAFRLYAGRPAFLGYKAQPAPDTFGDGLSEELRARALSDDVAERFDALGELVERWIARRLNSMRLTEAERAEWQLGFDRRRKKGMALLAAYQRGDPGAFAGFESCTVCDAAQGGCAGPKESGGGR